MLLEIESVLSELRQDHRNMAMLLDLIEHEANSVQLGGNPDWELMGDIMQYMTVYPDAVHHPKEDQLYAQLRSASPALNSGFDRISMDHRLIAAGGKRLRDDLAAIALGHVVDRKLLASGALRYVNGLRSHMQWEELDLFQNLSALSGQGYRFDTGSLQTGVDDPVFGPQTHRDYERLLDCIRTSSHTCMPA